MVRNYIKNTDDGRHPYITPLNAASHADLPPTILVTNGFDPLRDVGHAYARKLAAAGNDLTYVHNPDLTHGFPQFTRYSSACHQAAEELADLFTPGSADWPVSCYRSSSLTLTMVAIWSGPTGLMFSTVTPASR